MTDADTDEQLTWQPTADELKYLAMAALAGLVPREVGGMWEITKNDGKWFTPSRAAVTSLYDRRLIARDERNRVLDQTNHYKQTPSVDWNALMELMQ